MIRGGRGGGSASDAMEPEAGPLPVEAEEAKGQVRIGVVVAIVLGVVFLALMGYMAYTAATTPGFPYLFPALAMAYFGAAGVSDLAVGLTSERGTVKLWREGKFEESDQFLRHWRMLLGFVPGGVLPGFFLHRALVRVHPLVQLEKGGVPTPGLQRGSAVPGPAGYPAQGHPGAGYPDPSPYGSAPAGTAPSQYAPYTPTPATSDRVAPDPFGGAHAPAPATPSGTAVPGGPASVWSRPGAYGAGSSPGTAPPPVGSYSGIPAGPPPMRSCPTCHATLEGDSRFCKHCGAAVPA